MKTKLFLLVILLIGCQSTPETTQVELEQRETTQDIEGTWRVSGMFDDGFSWFSEYTFDDGSFRMQGYPPIDKEGTYTILSEDGNTFLVEIYPNEQDPYEASFTVAEDGSTLEWNQQIYTRVN